MGNSQRNILRVIALAAALSTLAVGIAVASTGTTLTTEHVSVGKVISTSSGHAVYLFTKDSGSRSNCTGSCASAWPPVTGKVSLAKGQGLNPKLLGTIKRSGGQTQATYNHHPLYLFGADKKARSTKGEGKRAFGGRWYLIGPRGAEVKNQNYCPPSGCQSY